jgi:hypothetical protein
VPQWSNKELIEITGVLAVVISLIFVGMELAQNTAAIRAQTVQSVQEDLRNQLDFSQELALVATKAPASRTPAEKLMRQQYFIRAMRSYENQWYHYSEGYLDEQLFLAYQQHLRITLGLEDFLERWKLHKELGFFHPDFVAFVDEFIAEYPPLARQDITVQFQE